MISIFDARLRKTTPHELVVAKIQFIGHSTLIINKKIKFLFL